MKDRDYNLKLKNNIDHKYAYNFNFDVIHPYMIKSFKPFSQKGNLLELGCYQGDFKKHFLEYFDDITCVEASTDSISKAQNKLKE